MCDIWKRTDDLELKRRDLEPHRESLRKLGVKWIVLSGGEPLLHQNLRALCEFFREENIRLTLLTSGLLLQRCAREVSDSFDDIIISLDGPEEIHDSIRGTQGGFRMIADGIRALRQLRPRMPISARSTIQKANHHCVRQTVKAARALEFDSVSFLAVDLTSEAFNRLPVWPSEKQDSVSLSEKELAAFQREIETLITEEAEEIASGFVAESPVKLRKIVDHFRCHLLNAQQQAPTCNAPWVSAVIEIDGTVRPCFFHQPIGNIHENSLQDVVNSSVAKQFRQTLDIATNPVCRRCVCSLNHKGSQ
jgi:MoaA/NifB/PqqE/SkfB family radical SAM enzyme